MIKIPIRFESCTWKQYDGIFFCEHDKTETDTYVITNIGFNGPYEVELQGFYCIDCGEAVEDYRDKEAEEQLMKVLNDEFAKN